MAYLHIKAFLVPSTQLSSQDTSPLILQKHYDECDCDAGMHYSTVEDADIVYIDRFYSLYRCVSPFLNYFFIYLFSFFFIIFLFYFLFYYFPFYLFTFLPFFFLFFFLYIFLNNNLLFL